MYIEEVEFSDFRNYSRLHLTPSAGLNILTGPNAQGKTNFLEGLGVLLVGRSFRGAKPSEMARWGTGAATVSGKVGRRGHSSLVRRVLAPREDQGWVVTGEGCPWARAIPFGWSDLAVVTGGPQGRRNFVDGFVAKLSPSYGATYRRYRQVLERRNRILQRGGRGEQLASRLDPWNEQLVAVGLDILAHRRQAVALLREEVARLYPMLGGRGGADLEYCSVLREDTSAQLFHDMVNARLIDECRRGRSLVGPHRDDIRLTVDGHDLKGSGSRGQQRLLALTLRLAEVGPVAEAVGSPPVLLLDDALSELDQDVQGRVIGYLGALGQVVLTTAERLLPEVDVARWWEVSGGQVMGAGVAALRGVA